MNTPSRSTPHPALTAGLLAVFCAVTPQMRAQPATPAPASADLPVENAILVAPPDVPPPVGRLHPARVIVDLTAKEVVKRLADGVTYTFWTFGGTVPGPLIRVREGDLVEFHLHNDPSSKMPHSIDLHAVTGPGGGAGASFTAPGHSSEFSFTALHAGLFVYHCATAPVPMHIANGMYGMILVEPKEGLPPADEEYYVMQGELYTAGRYGEPGLQSFDPEKIDEERPTYVVFNGAVGSLVGDNALKAKVGEKVRIYFGVGGPNLISSFHIVGEVFDTLYPEACFTDPQHFVQTTLVPPGGATLVEFTVHVPGTYTLVDHALTRAFNKGAVGMLKVTGPENKIIFSGRQADEIYLGQNSKAGSTMSSHPAAPAAPVSPTPMASPAIPGNTKEAQMERGKQVFMSACFACHQPDGKGLPGVFPPLAGSDFIKADRNRAIHIPIKGLSGPITVNGKPYNNIMPPQAFTDAQIADVLTYVMNSWGNNFGTVSAADVKNAREQAP